MPRADPKAANHAGNRTAGHPAAGHGGGLRAAQRQLSSPRTTRTDRPARRILLTGVDYTSGRGTGTGDSSRVYQVPVRNGRGSIGLSFEAHWLNLPVVQSPQSLREFLAGARANLIVKYRDSSNLTDRIRRLLRKSLGGDMPSLEDVSASLAVTPQTLRRRLRDEGRGFQQLKDETRRDAAIDYLLHTHWPLPEIAERVGFSDASTFHRAFKQWTGVAPGEYRLEHRAG